MLQTTRCFCTERIRMDEEALLRKAGTVQSIQIAVITVVPVIACSLTFITHTCLGYPLDATAVSTRTHAGVSDQ